MKASGAAPVALVVALLGTFGLLLVALVLLPYLRSRSGSLTLDFIVITVWALLTLAASWAQGNWLLSLLTSKWAGHDAGTGAAEAPTLSIVVSRAAILRAAIVLVAIILNFLWSNAVAGDFWFSYYSRVGAYVTALRSDDPQTRSWGLSRLARLRPQDAMMILPEVFALVGHPDTKQGREAIEVLAAMARTARLRLNHARGSTESSGDTSAAEALLQAIGKKVGDVAARVRDTRGDTRVEWIELLGSLGDRSSVPILEAIMQRGRAEERTAVLKATSLMPGLELQGLLVAAMKDPRERVRVLAAWVAGMVMAGAVDRLGAGVVTDERYKKLRTAVGELLARGEVQPACAFLQYFSAIGDQHMTGPLVRVARVTGFSGWCKRFTVKRPFAPPEPVVKEAEFGSILLNAMSSIAVGNEQLLDFLASAAHGANLQPRVRQRIEAILKEARRVEHQ